MHKLFYHEALRNTHWPLDAVRVFQKVKSQSGRKEKQDEFAHIDPSDTATESFLFSVLQPFQLMDAGDPLTR